jgi:hypothetical protein
VKELTLLFFSPFSTRCFSHDFLIVSLIFRTVSGIGFIYSVHPCPAETLSGSIILWFFLYSVLPFVILRQNGEHFLIWPGIVLLTDQVIFVPEWQKGEFVSL